MIVDDIVANKVRMPLKLKRRVAYYRNHACHNDVYTHAFKMLHYDLCNQVKVDSAREVRMLLLVSRNAVTSRFLYRGMDGFCSEGPEGAKQNIVHH